MEVIQPQCRDPELEWKLDRIGEATNPCKGAITVARTTAVPVELGIASASIPIRQGRQHIVYREANLSGASSVWLSFYRNNELNLS